LLHSCPQDKFVMVFAPGPFDYYGLSKFIAVIFFIFSILFYTGKDS